MRFRVTVHNVWTSAGKKLEGEVVDLPDAEVKALCDRGMGEVVDQPSAKTTRGRKR